MPVTRRGGGFFMPAGWWTRMAPRPGLEPDDIVTPTQAARLLGVPAETVRTWIHRYGIESLGKIGRWNVYDFRDIAAVEASKSPKAA